MAWLITPAQLEKFRKNQKSLLLLDASWHLPGTERNARAEFVEKHIADAHFFDLTLFHDADSPIPNQLIRDEKKIGELLGKAGVRDDYKIIFYDNSDLHSACRALWMMRVFGHNPHQLYILEGGLAAWEKLGGKIASGDVSSGTKFYTARFQPQLLRSLSDMKKNLETHAEQVVDLRHAMRYAGAPESRPGLRSGHIPDSHCFPYTSFFDKTTGCFLPLDKIQRLLADMVIDLKSPIVTTCGSGMTAPILNFILELMNHPQHALYDGSWSEWGAETLYPGENSLDERPVVRSVDKEP
ncbi:MAG TPA: sulfurtransferase [Gammaproteobacteria bacterium]|nr:sulfurtransferase [Gammaproteobacteria bacterium]